MQVGEFIMITFGSADRRGSPASVKVKSDLSRASFAGKLAGELEIPSPDESLIIRLVAPPRTFRENPFRTLFTAS